MITHKKIISFVTVVAVVLAVTTGISLASAADCGGVWTSAPSNPPQGNCDAPINGGRSMGSGGYQTKLGALWVNTDTVSPQVVGFVSNGQSWFNGTVRITGGSPVAGKVLMATNSSGDAIWAATTTSSGSSSHGTILINNPSGNWTVPAGVNSIEVQVVGGGAAGEANGGMGGGYATAIMPVTPGSTIAYTTGSGGIAGCNTATSGGNTTFGSIVAYGGSSATSFGNPTFPVTAATSAGWLGGDWGAYGHSWLDAGAIIQAQNGDKTPGYASGFPFSRGGGATTNMPQTLTGVQPTYGGGGNGDRDYGDNCYTGGNGASGIIIIKY